MLASKHFPRVNLEKQHVSVSHSSSPSLSLTCHPFINFSSTKHAPSSFKYHSLQFSPLQFPQLSSHSKALASHIQSITKPKLPSHPNSPLLHKSIEIHHFNSIPMDSTNLKQRFKDEEPTTTTTSDSTTTRKEKKMAMAKKGLKSLSIALGIPMFLSILVNYLFGPGQAYKLLPKPFWFPPLWALYFCIVFKTFLMGLSTWLVWAEGGFHRHPNGLPISLAQFALSLSWKPLVFVLGATRLGLAICLAQFCTLYGCLRIYRQVNPIAGDLVKPCLAWMVFLSLLNYKLINL